MANVSHWRAFVSGRLILKSLVAITLAVNVLLVAKLENVVKNVQDETSTTSLRYVTDNVRPLEVPTGLRRRGISTSKADQYLDQIKRMEGKMHLPTSWSSILRIPSTGDHSFNVTASDLVGNIRETIVDSRPKECLKATYDIEKMPKTSVIIIFHNEARSTLLRTIHSVLLRTPEALLQEIILVDDASTMAWLAAPLDDLVKVLPKTRLIRLVEREGLIRARLAGAKNATGPVLFFLDAHSEVNKGWLEPLVQRILDNRRVVAVPEMDVIRWQDFRYVRPAGLYHGSFTWDLRFKYRPYKDNRTSVTAPIPSPVMVGCAHAVDRNYFFKSGAYDSGMDIWGGENLEHSFRVWMCGGRVEILPCSHVGHVFKPRLPFSFKGDSSKIIQQNLIRTAEVWLDDYKDLFYATQRTLAPVDLQSLARRKHLRSRLKCQTFEWYLKNVVPDMPLPPVTATKFGQVASLADKTKCLGSSNSSTALKIADCEQQDSSQQFFYLDTAGRFMYKGRCIRPENRTRPVIGECSNGLMLTWAVTQLDALAIRHNATTSLCLQLSTDDFVRLATCDDQDNQKWTFSYSFDLSKTRDIAKVVADAQQIPDSARYFGFLKHVETDRCVQAYDTEQHETMVEMVNCRKQRRYEQSYYLDAKGHLRFKDNCMCVTSPDNVTVAFNRRCCQTTTSSTASLARWHYDAKKGQLQLTPTRRKDNSKALCLSYDPRSPARPLQALPCQEVLYQKWRFRKRIVQNRSPN